MQYSNSDCSGECAIKNMLALAHQNGTIVAIYNNKDNTRAFWTGYICRIDDLYILLAHIQSSGLYDGYFLLELSSIYRIERDTPYLHKIEKLYQHNEQHHPELIQKTISIINDVLLFAKENLYVLSIQLLNSGYDDVIGTVKNVEDGFLHINVLDEYGICSGETTLELQTITRIACDTEDEHPIYQLMNFEK